GTYNWLMAHLLAGEGWRVHVLYCGAVRSARELAAVSDQLQRSGIGWSYLHDIEEPPVLRVPGTHDALNVYLSDRVRYALEELHDEHHFDLAEFGEWGALGFRAIQARRAGLAFADLPMAVKLPSSFPRALRPAPRRSSSSAGWRRARVWRSSSKPPASSGPMSPSPSWGG